MNARIRTFFIIGLLLCPSFALRWGYVKNTEIDQPLRADAFAYTVIARNLAKDHLFTEQIEHHGKPGHVGRPPGYPFFLAGIMAFTDSLEFYYYGTLLVQSLLGALTVVLAYLLARFLLPWTWAMGVALLVMLSPHMIAMSAFVLSESLFTFLLLLSLLLILQACLRPGAGRFLLAGGVLGLAIFVRPVLAVFPLLAVLLLYLACKERRQRSRLPGLLALFLLASFALPASWTVWRTVTLGPDTRQAGQLKTALLCGTYPQITYKSLPGMPYREDPSYRELMAKSYPEIGRHIMTQIAGNPGLYLRWWLVGKPAMYWSWKVFFGDAVNFYPVRYSWFDIDPLMKALRAMMLGLHPGIPLLAFGGLGLFFLEPRSREQAALLTYGLCFVLIAHFTLMFTLLAPFPRYALPLGPELYLLSVFTLWKGGVLLKERWKRKHV